MSKDQKDSQKILKRKPEVPSFGARQNLGGGNEFQTQNAGLASVVAMTPMQGMKLINPD